MTGSFPHQAYGYRSVLGTCGRPLSGVITALVTYSNCSRKVTFSRNWSLSPGSTSVYFVIAFKQPRGFPLRPLKLTSLICFKEFEPMLL